jgi:hypothetical protein
MSGAFYDREKDTITITIDNVAARAKAAAPTSKGDNMLLCNVNQLLDVVAPEIAGSSVRVMCNAIFASPAQAKAKADAKGKADADKLKRRA